MLILSGVVDPEDLCACCAASIAFNIAIAETFTVMISLSFFFTFLNIKSSYLDKVLSEAKISV